MYYEALLMFLRKFMPKEKANRLRVRQAWRFYRYSAAVIYIHGTDADRRELKDTKPLDGGSGP